MYTPSCACMSVMLDATLLSSLLMNTVGYVAVQLVEFVCCCGGPFDVSHSSFFISRARTPFAPFLSVSPAPRYTDTLFAPHLSRSYRVLQLMDQPHHIPLVRPLPFVSTTALPMLMFGPTSPLRIASASFSAPFSRICCTTSTSFFVPKSFSSCWSDGVRKRPCEPWFEKRTWNAVDEREVG